MFGALKRIFSRKPSPPPSPAPAEQPITRAGEPTGLQSSGAMPRARLPAPAPPAIAIPDELISVPLSPIVASLPANLAPLVVAHRGASFSLSLRAALAQLPTGAVRVSFGELRNGSPPGAFSENVNQDASLVDLPLAAIIAKINPAYLARRPGQKQIVVPDHVTAIFGPKGRPAGATPAPEPSTPAAAFETPPPAPTPVAAPAPAPTPAAPRPAAVETPPFAAPRPAIPASPPPAPAPAISFPKPSPIPAAAPKPPAAPLPSAAPKPAPGPLPSATPKAPAGPLGSPLPRAPGIPSLPPPLPKAPARTPLPFAAKGPSVAPTPKPPTPAAVPSPAPLPAVAMAPPVAAHVEAEDAISVPLAGISGGWPADIREQIVSLQNSAVSLPLSRLDAAMKTGRLSFTWGDLSQWITPAPPEAPPQNSGTLLEVPLNLVAPLYMARRRPSLSQKKVVIPESIPGVFSGAPAPVEEAPAPPAIESPAEAPAVRGPTLGELLGQPSKTEWPPQHVTQYMCLLDGIAGALLATSEGLPMSGQMPAHINCETLSAFVPQMFSRMSQSAAEMRLGQVTSVVVTAGQAPYAILRAGTLYLVALGQSGRPLPESVLQQIAAQLANTNQ